MALKQILEERYWATNAYSKGNLNKRLSLWDSGISFFINNKSVTEEEFRKQEKRISVYRIEETKEDEGPIMGPADECEPVNYYAEIKKITQYMPLF